MRSLVAILIVVGTGLGLASCAGRPDAGGAASVAARPADVAVLAVAETAVPVQLADGAAEPAPAEKVAEKPALPAGHPVVEQPGLPAGHPQLPAGGAGGANAGLPEGHPQLPGAGGGDAGLPSGHPKIGMTTPAAPGTKGSIVIKAVQRTKGGPAVGADAVTVEYYNAQGETAGKREAKLSDKGEVKIDDVPLTVPVQPLITITHAGVEYKAPGNVMDGGHRDQEVEVSVFETTDQEPAWQVRMRHVIVEPSREGLKVTDMISVFNPADRSWTGKPVEGGKPVTLAIALPATATNVSAGGAFHDCCVKVVDGKLIYSMPMLPGGADFQIHYVVPAKDDAAEVALVAPAATGSLFVFIPEDGSVLTSKDLKVVEAKPGARLRANSRFYTAPGQKTGERVTFTVSGLKGLKAAAATTPFYAAEDGSATADAGGIASPATAGVTSNISGVAKVAAGAGAAAVVAVGVAILVFKSPKPVGVKR